MIDSKYVIVGRPFFVLEEKELKKKKGQSIMNF
jgi:hypothetical protein